MGRVRRPICSNEVRFGYLPQVGNQSAIDVDFFGLRSMHWRNSVPALITLPLQQRGALIGDSSSAYRSSESCNFAWMIKSSSVYLSGNVVKNGSLILSNLPMLSPFLMYQLICANSVSLFCMRSDVAYPLHSCSSVESIHKRLLPHVNF